jgi:hypothetical protein
METHKEMDTYFVSLIVKREYKNNREGKIESIRILVMTISFKRTFLVNSRTAQRLYNLNIAQVEMSQWNQI